MVAVRSSEYLSEDTFDLSLICSTIGRVDDLRRMIDSLAAAARRSARVQLIVIDQSADQVAKPILADVGPGLSWEYLTSRRGLSVGRNVGLPLVRGRLVAFPDDDCTYTPGLIDEVVAFFDRRRHVDGLLVRAVWQTEGDDVLRYPPSSCEITRGNVLRTGISYGIFLRRTVLATCGRFDESLGVGSGTAWGAGEEADYLLRALRGGHRLWFEPNLTVLHPERWQTTDRDTRNRSLSYGRGIGHVLRKHSYRPHYPAYLAGRRAAKSALLAARGQLGEARVAGAWSKGLLTGYLDVPTEPSS